MGAFDPRQRMHHDRVLREVGEDVRGHGKRVPDALVLGRRIALEPLLLDPGHVEHVRAADPRREILGLDKGDPVAAQVGEQVLLHLHRPGRDQPEGHARILRQQVAQGPGRPSVQEIARDGDGRPVQRAADPPDRVRIEQRLGGMLPRAVPRVEHGHRPPRTGIRRHAGRALRRSFLVVPDDDRRRPVPARHADRVLDRLALGRRGELARRFRGKHASAEMIGGELEREPGAGAGLIEEREDDLALEQVAAAAVDDLLREARLTEHAV